MAYVPFGGNAADNPSEVGGDNDSADTGGGATAFFLGSGGSSGGDSRDAGGNEFDASIHVSRDKLNADGTFRKKRGRRSGNSASTRSKSQADYSASIDSLARMLGFVHLGIAAASKTPELVLNEEETKALAGATAKVLEEFDIRPDPKVEAVVGLVTTAGAICGPKVYFIRERKRAERRQREEQ